MTTDEKLIMLKNLLQIKSNDISMDDVLTEYLAFAQNEIINWRYGMASNSPLAKVVFSGECGSVTISTVVFIASLTPTNGAYVFTYSEANKSWQYDGANVALADYGITYHGLSPHDADIITVTYNDRYLADYDMTQIMACVVGFGLSGAEGQTSHSENGIQRSFKYTDMIGYLHNHVMPYVGVI